MVGGGSAIAALPLHLGLINTISLVATTGGVGLAVDLASDFAAKEGKVVINREVVLNASDVLRHVQTFYTSTESNTVARIFRQKHEWLVLESHTHRYYTVQKNPANGDLLMDVRNSLRAANDVGLKVAGKPTMSGEIKQHRMDQQFDLPNDLQVAYVIAWLRKEDARWAFSTENCRHFTTKLRYALNDF